MSTIGATGPQGIRGPSGAAGSSGLTGPQVLRVSHTSERFIFRYYSPSVGTIMNITSLNRGTTFTPLALRAKSDAAADITLFWRLSEIFAV